MLSGISADDKTLRKVSMKHSSSSRHKQGDTLGNDKIPAYQNEILSMWRRVNLEDAKKMSPYEMQRTFQMNHSDCLDIPAVQHITNYDSSLNQVKRKPKSPEGTLTRPLVTVRPANVDEKERTTFMRIPSNQIVAEKPNIKPKQGY